MMKCSCASNAMFFLIFACLVLLHSSSTAEELDLNLCDPAANYTSGSQFQTNLNLFLLPSPVSNGSLTGFFNTSSYGGNPITVYGLVQCRGDITMEDCSTCLNSAKVEIINQCPEGKRAFIRFESCLLRYSDINFFSQVGISPMKPMPSANRASNADVFNRQVESLMKRLTTDAASNPSKFQIGFINYTDTENIYGLVQCTRDLSKTDCLSCLQNMIQAVDNPCKGKEGCRAICASCIVRYEKQPFFDLSLLPPLPPPQAPSQTNTTGGGESSMKVVKIVVPIAVGVLVLLSGSCAYSRWRKINRGKNISEINSKLYTAIKNKYPSLLLLLEKYIRTLMFSLKI